MNFLKKISCWILVALGLVGFQQNALAQCVQAACTVDFELQLSQCGEADIWSHDVDPGTGTVTLPSGVVMPGVGATVLGQYASENQCFSGSVTTPRLSSLNIQVLDASGTPVFNDDFGNSGYNPYFPFDFHNLAGGAATTFTVSLRANDATGNSTFCTTEVTVLPPTCPAVAGTLSGTEDLGTIECTEEPTQNFVAPTGALSTGSCAWTTAVVAGAMDMIPNTDSSTGAHCFTLTQTWTLVATCTWTGATSTLDNFTQSITIIDSVLPEIIASGGPAVNDANPEIFTANENHTNDCYVGTPDECISSTEAAGLPVYTFDECDFDVALKMIREANFGEVLAGVEHTFVNDPRQDNYYCYNRLFVYRAEDNCGNLSEDSLIWIQRVMDTEAPTFDVDPVSDVTINSCSLNATTSVSITVSNMNDNCAERKYLALFATVYNSANQIVSIVSGGSSDYAQGLTTFSVTVPGSDACEAYRVEISMKDPCLNSSNQTVTFNVCNPNEGPIAKCDEVSVTLAPATDTADPDDYRAEVDAVDVDEGSEDLCTDLDQVIDGIPNTVDYTFFDDLPAECNAEEDDFDGCLLQAADLGATCLSSLNIGATQVVYVNYNYVIVQIRRAGTSAWMNTVDFTEADCAAGMVTVELRAINSLCEVSVCETTIDVQGCPDTGNFVSGRILNEDGAPIKNVTVNGAAGMTAMTDAAGNFNVAGTVATPVFDNDHTNGVSSYDLYLMRRHILGIQALGSAYKMVAADANNDGFVKASDLSNIQNLIVNNSTTFANNTSWNFIDASYAIDANNFGSAPKTGMGDFVAVKTGDVNLSAGTVLRAAGTLEFAIEDRVVTRGEEFTVALGASEFNNIAALQMTMAYRGLEVVGFETGLEEVAKKTVGERTAMVWAGNEGTTIANGEAVINVTFRAKEAGKLSNLFNVSSDITAAQAYDATGTMFNVAFRFTSVGEDFALFQNAPNPFNGVTVIGFNLPQASNATITIYDVAGRVLKSVNADYAKGYNQIDINSGDLPSAGVLHYQLTAGEFTAVKQMVIVE